MKTYDHIIRFALLIVLVILGFFIVRASMVPDSFGVHGSYTYAYFRAESQNEQAELPCVYQGTQHCASCHEQQAAVLTEDKHAGLDCESCHGSFKAHNNNMKGRMAITEPVDSCMLCHRELNARPEEFPQIASLAAHLEDQGETLQNDITCSACHDPHTPVIAPQTDIATQTEIPDQEQLPIED